MQHFQIISSPFYVIVRVEAAKQLAEEKKNRSKWYPIAPDGEIPNSVIRDLLTSLSCHKDDEALEFTDIAMLIAKVRSYYAIPSSHLFSPFSVYFYNS